MLILLIRHGETDWNHQGRRQGRRDVPLNEAGREQMRRCAEQLRGLRVDTILTSPLSRESSPEFSSPDLIARFEYAPSNSTAYKISRAFCLALFKTNLFSYI